MRQLKRGICSMKKLLVFVLVFCLFSLVSCDPGSFWFNHDELTENVKSIELIEYNNDAAEKLFNNTDKVLPFDFDKMEIIETLSDEKKEIFIDDISNQRFLLVWEHLNSPQGRSVKITYQNGDFDILCCNVQFSCQYDSTGTVKKVIGHTVGAELPNKYFITQS
jgi:hypothetical protein